MESEQAITGLELPENREIKNAIGIQLRERAHRPDWSESVILRQLASRDTNLGFCNQLFSDARLALADGNGLQKRAALLLGLRDFDNHFEDFIAELRSVCYLKRLGHKNIRFTVAGELVTADLTSSDAEFNYVTEAKNLREIVSFTSVAFRSWSQLRFEKPEDFEFGIELVSIDNPIEPLTKKQAEAVRSMIQSFPGSLKPGKITRTLPEGRRVAMNLLEGPSTMWTSGRPILVHDVLDEYKRALMLKLMCTTRTALSQLYSDGVPKKSRRLLFVRWNPPEEILCAGEVQTLSKLIENHYQSFVSQFFDNFAIVIVSSWQGLEEAPTPTWQTS